MRINLDKKHFTKAERKFGRKLQELHIPFKVKQIINGREVDFICGQYAIDIDGHLQHIEKNKMLFKMGYMPLHISNKSVSNEPFRLLEKYASNKYTNNGNRT